LRVVMIFHARRKRARRRDKGGGRDGLPCL
jgi:hypothetical protein